MHVRCAFIAVALRRVLRDTRRPRQGMNVSVLGEPRFASPVRRTVDARERIPAEIVRVPGAPPQEEMLFELAGARDRLYFDPKETRAGIVTCGGLCPGLNDVVQNIVYTLVSTPACMLPACMHA